MLDDLLLLRLWAARDAVRGEIRSRVAADLRPITASADSGGENWRTVFAASIKRLEEAGLLAVGGQRGARLQLTDAGRERVRTVFQILGGERRVAGWTWWRDRYALPLALGGEQPDTADDLRSTLLRRLYLPELAGRGRMERLQRAVDLLLAKRLKASQISLAAFRQAALRDWAGQQNRVGESVEPDTTKRVEMARSAGRLADDLVVFAEQTLLAARRSPSGRFGDAKVFISHVWRGLLAAGQAASGEQNAFNERLVRANTAGLLRLSRADLAGAHAEEDVRESEIEYLGEKFHFVRLD